MQNYATKKPTTLRATASTDGDVCIDGFEFLKEHYCKMMPNIVFVLDELFRNMFTNDAFTIFISTSKKNHVARNKDDTFEVITNHNGKN